MPDEHLKPLLESLLRWWFLLSWWVLMLSILTLLAFPAALVLGLSEGGHWTASYIVGGVWLACLLSASWTEGRGDW